MVFPHASGSSFWSLLLVCSLVFYFRRYLVWMWGLELGPLCMVFYFKLIHSKADCDMRVLPVTLCSVMVLILSLHSLKQTQVFFCFPSFFLFFLPHSLLPSSTLPSSFLLFSSLLPSFLLSPTPLPPSLLTFFPSFLSSFFPVFPFHPLFIHFSLFPCSSCSSRN